MGITFEAGSKLILLGEHSAVYGFPALGLSLPWKLYVTCTESQNLEVRNLLPDQEKAVQSVVELLQAVRQERKLQPLEARTLSIETEIPLSCGFGSSGALCAALARAYFPESTLEDLDTISWRAEKLFHGTPSGIDTSLALRNGFWALRTQSVPVQATALTPHPLSLVVGAVPRVSDTKTLVSGLRRRWDSQDATVQRNIEKLGALTHRAIELFQNSPRASFYEAFSSVVQSARESLRSLDLETETLTQTIDLGLKCGATAGKLSGAGGGGAFFLVFSNPEDAGRAAHSIAQRLGEKSWTMVPRVVNL